MLCDQVNKGIVLRLDKEEGLDTAISIKHGNFFWGVEDESTTPSDKDSA